MESNDYERKNNILDLAYDLDSVVAMHETDPNLGPSLFAVDN
jgi:hypothetical protein